jgi:Glyoxalase/Bleomycin resistance protein/Dioxygenase superfamily
VLNERRPRRCAGRARSGSRRLQRRCIHPGAHSEREKILARYAHFALGTEDADQWASKIAKLGLPVRDVVSGPTSLRQILLKNPDGNMVEFIGPTKSAAPRRMEPYRARVPVWGCRPTISVGPEALLVAK